MKDYIEFQERNAPLAYFLSFRGYGTWLHGDERLSMDRKNFNKFGEGKIPVNNKLQKTEFSKLKNEPFLFDASKRKIIKEAIYEVCQFRNYRLIAINIRTNHLHCVVSGNAKPELIMNSFKAYATRKLRNALEIPIETKIWSRHGSTRYLWTEKQIEEATDYVLNGQGDFLPNFQH